MTDLSKNQLAEQAGSTIAHRMLEALKSAPTQAQRLAIVEGALTDVCGDQAARAVIGGFAVVLTAYLDAALGVQ